MTANPLSSELLALAERVEALTGPDAATDEAIHAAIKGVTIEWQEHEKRNAYHRDGRWVSIGPVPPYSASLDSAMTLAGYSNGRPHNVVLATAYGSAHICPCDGASYGISDPLTGRARAQGEDEIGRAARAVTAASLRAIAAQQPNTTGESK